jgi:hypothetical protein
METDVYDRAADGTLINGKRSWVVMGPGDQEQIPNDSVS